MANETPVPLPLNGEEVRNAVLFKLNESLEKSCHLSEHNAYSSFRAEITVRLTLSDFGRDQADNHIIAVEQKTETEGTPEYVEERTVILDPAPPNQVRIETEQTVPVDVKVGDKTVRKNLRYAPRKISG